MSSKIEPDQATVYQIRLQGQLDHRWSDWFDGMAIVPDGSGETLLTGPVADQAALHGLLRKVRDLGLPLLSVNRVEPGAADTPDVTGKIKQVSDELSS